MPTKDLAKALHTLTTVPNVATYLVAVSIKMPYKSAFELTRAALMIVNPAYDYSAAELARIHKAEPDGLIGKIVTACSAVLGK